jgi:hypothetical protein
MVYYIIKNLSRPFRRHGGAGQGGCEQVHLDVACCHFPFWETGFLGGEVDSLGSFLLISY